MFATDDMARDAVLSPCGLYRYRLGRTWDASTARVCWVMLNPSTADASVDDPTIRRCIGFARAWGFGGLDVVNLFALRSPDPRALRTAADPVGPENDRHILDVAGRAGLVVCAWGADGFARSRARSVLGSLAARGLVVHRLASTREGAPAHPLYLAGGLMPVPWRAGGGA